MGREEGPLSYQDQDQIEQERRDRIREEFKGYLAFIERIDDSVNSGELNSFQKRELEEKLKAILDKLV